VGGTPPDADSMRRFAPKAPLAVVLAGVCPTIGAQPIKLIDACPSELAPRERISPQFPASSAFNYRATVSFIIDIGGTVLVPRVTESRLAFTDAGGGSARSAFDSALVTALARWRYPPRSRPCSATVELVFG
jgi:hypothetical protein